MYDILYVLQCIGTTIIVVISIKLALTSAIIAITLIIDMFKEFIKDGIH